MSSTRFRPSMSAILAAAALTMATASTIAGEPRILGKGHVDGIAPRWLKDRLVISVKDDTREPTVFRTPDGVLMYAKPDAALVIPDDLPPPYAAVLPPAGTRVWILPEVQEPEILWLGWSTEALPFGVFQNDRVRYALTSVAGPGELIMFDSGIEYGSPAFADTRDGLPDAWNLGVGSHVHSNWVFTKAGDYRVRFRVSGTLLDGTPVSASATYGFRVGTPPPGYQACDGFSVTIKASTPGETIVGTRGPDVIAGGPGRDVIRGRGGHDLICGGDGRDVISAGPGADVVLAGAGVDTVYGGDGPDVIAGGPGDDRLFGGRDADTIRGGAGDDHINGGPGDDWCVDGSGMNVVTRC